MISLPHYLRIVRASAWYDLLVTVGFATPWTFVWIHHSLTDVIEMLRLPGAFPLFEPAHILMVNLLGSVVTVWALLRLRHAQQHLGHYDAAARFLFAAWQIYAVAHGANVVVLAFTLFEIIFGFLQCMPVKHASLESARLPAA